MNTAMFSKASMAALAASFAVVAGCLSPRPTDDGLPSREDVLVAREGYTLGYRFSENQPAWVAESLDGARIAASRSSGVRRSGDFRPDPLVPEGHRVLPSDYSRTGYDRGHMAPAADFRWSKSAMSESFYMSNMSPQRPECNRRTWAGLEAAVRDWAVEHGRLEVVTGPVFGGDEAIGPEGRRISVPPAYYKALLAPAQRQMVAFVVPNAASTNSLESFVRSVDEVEAATGLDLFRDEASESSVSTNFWFGPGGAAK